MSNKGIDSAVPRSTFVSVVAWIFIALAGFGLLISILQNIIIGLVSSQQEFTKLLEESQKGQIPEFMLFMLENLQLIVFLTLLLVILLLAASIGLLLRKNWARKTFIAYMFVSCVYMIAGSILQMLWMNEILQAQGFNTSTASRSSFMELMTAIQYMAVIFNIAIGMLFGWIGWKLTCPAIRQEFLPSRNMIEV